jgi:hypothetical protein
VAATVAHAVKGGDGKEEGNVNAAAALPHAVAPVGALSVYFCGGERSVYSCVGAEESKGGDGEMEKDSDAAAALPHAVAPVGAPSVYSCGGAEERKGCDGDTAATFAHALALVVAPSAAAAGLYVGFSLFYCVLAFLCWLLLLPCTHRPRCADCSTRMKPSFC